MWNAGLVTGAVGIVLLGTGFISCAPQGDDAASEASEAAFSRPQIAFEDISEAISFTRASETKAPGFAGAAWVDYNGDGRQDLFLTNGKGHKNGLFRSEADGSFTDVSAEAQIGNGAGNSGVVAADLDNDGWIDLVLSGDYAGKISTPMTIYRNKGDGTFEDITASSKLVGPTTAFSAAMADIDNDRDLDLFVTAPGFMKERHHSKLYRNEHSETGTIQFTDITEAVAVDAEPLGACVTGFSDYDNDGDGDLFVGNCIGASENPIMQLFRNDTEDEIRFTNVTDAAGLQPDKGFWMTTSFADYDHDGDIDLFSTNTGTTAEGPPPAPHALFRNNGDGTFSDVANQAGVANWEFGWGASFTDFDNDGYDDILYSGSFPFPPPNFIGPDRGNPTRYFSNNGESSAPTFTEMSTVLTVELWNSFTSGVAHGDYNQDGFSDVVIVRDVFKEGASGAPVILKNDSRSAGNKNHWIGIALEGVESNRFGIGAKVVVTAGDSVQTKEIYAGSSFLSTDSPTLLFGLGQHSEVSSIRVEWPSGCSDAQGTTAADQFVTITESCS